MGMFDELRCLAPLPISAYQGLEFQTKDLDCCLDLYEIRADGTLWRQDYDVEDRSDPSATGLMRIVGMRTRVNKRWVRLADFTGHIGFYTSFGDRRTGWIAFSALFKNGELKGIEVIKEKPATPPAGENGGGR